MKDSKQIMSNTTLNNQGSFLSKLPVPYDITEGQCEGCGETFKADYKYDVPGGRTIHINDKTHCFKCEMKLEEKQRVQQLLQENEERKANRVFRVFENHSLMNEKLKAASFDNYVPPTEELENIKNISMRYANNFDLANPVSLLFMGTYGIGKSHLAASITKELLEKRFSCIFISTPKLMSKLKATYNRESDIGEEEIIESLSSVQCLVLDDIGAESTKATAENMHSWATSKLFEIIDNRVGKHTIFTTNFSAAELQSKLGGRNFSRMMEDTLVLKMVGDDYRLRKFNGKKG